MSLVLLVNWAGQPSFPGMVWPIDKVHVLLSLEEVALHTGHRVLMEFDDNSSLIVGDP